ncbi:ATP-binding protein [Roseiterribacter gracilis]|uniref:histidine kinase n=1 Tax=Roseiterribacter gracilis TaxID=2812848 RepID=A0A8S8XJF0_9PROT|nr:hypothetical protein TMPK1_30970 [Rhodospirillales bacterium TMPK1]
MFWRWAVGLRARLALLVASILIPAALLLAQFDLIETDGRDEAILIVLLLIIGVAWLHAELFVLRWVRRLRVAAEQFATGALAYRVCLPSSSGEFAVLGATFNRMADALSARHRELKTYQRVLEAQACKVIQSEARFRDIAELAGDFFWECGADGRITYLSERFTQVTMMPVEHLLYTLPHERVGIFVDDGDFQNILAAFESHAPFRNMPLCVTLPDGEPRWWRLSGKPMYDPVTGSFRGFRGAGHEVTVAVLAEETVRVEKERAEKASEAKSEFLATMSHELRTPLNAIIGFAEMIRGEVRGPVGAPAYRDYGQLIADSGRHLLGLIDDVLDVGQAEAGRLKLQCGPVDLIEIATGAVAMLRNEADKASLQLNLHAATSPIVMSADARRLRQVLLNVIGNAIKFTPAGGSIDVTIERTPSHTRQITVRDSGIGIAEQDLPFVQQPFYQAEQSYTRRYHGVGLGLAICTQLVELHHGTLSIASELGRGTTITIQFPPPGSVEFVSGIAERIAL